DVRRYSAIPVDVGSTEIPVRDRPGQGGERREAVCQPLCPLPWHLRRKVDLSEQDHPAKGNWYRSDALSRYLGGVCPLLQPEPVRPATQGVADGRLCVATHGRLPGSAAGWHLGDGSLLPQWLGADGLRCLELEGSPEVLHALVPHRRRCVRHSEAGLE